MEIALVILSFILFLVIIYLFINNKSVKDTISDHKKLETEHFNVHTSKINALKTNLDKHVGIFRQQLQEIEKEIELHDVNYISRMKELSESINGIDQKYNSVLEKLVKANGEILNSLHLRLIGINNLVTQNQVDNAEQLNQLSDVLLKKINQIKLDNEVLRKKLEYFTEIKDDSNTLNESIDTEKEDELIRSILKAKVPQIDEEIVNSKDSFVRPVEITDQSDSIHQNEEIIEPKTNTNEVQAEDNKSNIDINEYSAIEYKSYEKLHAIIKENLDNDSPVLIKIASSYSDKGFVGTIQRLKSIGSLYPDKHTFYGRFDSHSIGMKSIDQFLIRNKESFIPEVIDEKIEVEHKKHDSGLDEQQEKAYHMMENCTDNLFISGKAGTGKSFLLKLFSLGTQKKHLIVAPTGIAALNVNGVTIHSAFGYDNLELGNELEYIKLSNEKKEALRKIDVLIIDEISMVRADMLDKIDLIFQKLNNNTRLFGGKQIFVFGDLFQLPPIANGDENKYLQDRYGGIYFFQSDAYRNGNFQYIELFENHRQDGDLAFFNILNNIREGNITDGDIANLNRRYSPTIELRRVLKLFPKKEKVEQVNSEELSTINAKEYIFESITEYARDSNQTKNIENIFPISFSLKLKLGSLIMMVKNDVNKRWVNGTLGIISYVDENRLKVTIDGTEYEVEKEYFESKDAKYLNGKIVYETALRVKQYPLILAYAITIHKSQGMTYKNVACDLSETFATGQSYVALSRCSSLDGLHLMSRITGKEIKVSPSITSFYKKINSLEV